MLEASAAAGLIEEEEEPEVGARATQRATAEAAAVDTPAAAAVGRRGAAVVVVGGAVEANEVMAWVVVLVVAGGAAEVDEAATPTACDPATGPARLATLMCFRPRTRAFGAERPGQGTEVVEEAAAVEGSVAARHGAVDAISKKASERRSLLVRCMPCSKPSNRRARS